MIRHHILLRFRGDVGPEQKAELFGQMARVAERFDGVRDFQFRGNVSVEAELTRRLGDMFWFDLDDAAARDRFLADPDHLVVAGRVVAALEGGIEGVTVIDYEIG